MIESIRQQIILFAKKTLDKLNDIKEEFVSDVNLEFSSTKEPVPFSNVKKYKFQRISVGEQWSNTLFDCAWFHATANLDFDTKKCYFKFDPDGEGLIYDNEGHSLFGITNFCCVYEDYSFGRPGKVYLDLDYFNIKKTLDVYIDVGNNDPFGNFLSGKVIAASIVKIKPIIKKIINDLSFFVDLSIHAKDEEYKDYLLTKLEKILVLFNNNNSDEELKTISDELDKLKEPSDSSFVLKATGHSHLDLAWLWPIRESKRKVARTVASLLYFLDKYPNYIFGISQPQQLAWLKEDYPDLFLKLKNYVNKGRIELQGAMWVESDTNIPCGESLIRQVYYGKKFWKEEFNKDINNVFLPDCFGFSYCLPQIAKSCNLDHFLTIKLDRNEINRFPLTTFNWRGIDGSVLLAHFPPEADYNSTLAPGSLLKAEKLFKEHEKLSEAIELFGIGDGGGGPNETHLEFMERSLNQKGLPKVVPSKVEDFFSCLEQHKNKLDTYDGELYLEKHQGTLTSQAKNKYYNRLIENKFCCIESLMAVCDNQDFDELEKYWKEALLYQFHDILPGSAIARVYSETERSYSKLIACLNNILNSFQGQFDNLVAYNPSPFEKHGYKEINGNIYYYLAKPYSSSKLELAKLESDVIVKDLTISNEYLNVVLDEDGNIVSIFSKVLNKEMIKGKTNFFIYNDNGGDCWDIYQRYYLEDKKNLILQDCSIYRELDKAGYTLKYSYKNSILVVKLYLKNKKNGLFFDCSYENNMFEEMLRFDINPSFNVDKAAFNLQYGHIYRSTKEDSLVEKAKFEVCGHKFVDYSNENYGFSLINDSKYGFRVKNDLISMNLMRSQNKPCKNQDIGFHLFSFEIYPHENSLEYSDVYKEAYNFNRGIQIYNMKPREFDFKSNNPYVILDWVKPSFDKKGIVVRLYNCTSREQKIDIPSTKTIYQTDSLENNRSELKKNSYTFEPFELVTIYIKK